MQSDTKRLTVWTCIGACGCVGVIYGGLTESWLIFVPSILATLAAQFMLMTGLFLRWPKSDQEPV